MEDIRDAMLDVYILAAHEAQNVLTSQRFWPITVNVRKAVKQAMATARDKLKEGVPTNVLPQMEEGRGHASLGELLVVRIAYFKGYLQNKAKGAALPEGDAASNQDDQSRRYWAPRLTLPRLTFFTSAPEPQPSSNKMTKTPSSTRMSTSAATSSLTT